MVFQKGNQYGKLLKGIKRSEESKINYSLSKLGDKNPMWRGNNIDYNTLHAWVRRNHPPPELCQICNKIPPYDLANITGNYNRDIGNWKYLCRRCHMLSDGRFDKFTKQTFQMRSEVMKKAWISRKDKVIRDGRGRIVHG